MATGDQADFVSRLKAALPSRWFPAAVDATVGVSALATEDGDSIIIETGATLLAADGSADAPASDTPILDAVLAGLAAPWATLYSLYAYVRAQARIATASDSFLDMIAADYFGVGLQRQAGEDDAAYRARIKAALFAPRGTRAAMTAALTALTGRTPWIFEPTRPADTGGYGQSGMTAGTALGYGVAGGYGNLALPFQAFIVAYRPPGTGIPQVAGYGSGPGAYGTGATATAVSGTIEYATLAYADGAVSDAVIYATIDATRPAATVAWARISN